MTDDTIFFGDRCEQGGNDHTISRVADKFHQVDGWADTRYIINSYYA